jgi:hypothetical protein
MTVSGTWTVSGAPTLLSVSPGDSLRGLGSLQLSPVFDWECELSWDAFSFPPTY